MKDFDPERQERHLEREQALGDRSFRIGGEVFAFRANVSYEVLREVARLGEEDDGTAVIDGLERTVLNMIEDTDDAHARFLDVCTRPDDPVTFFDLNALCVWLIQEQTGRPTEAPSHSVGGRSTTSTDSTEDSSSPLAEVSAA